MKLSCAMGRPGHSLIGIRVRLVISRVSVPAKPGSTNPAVACTMSPRRPRLDLPSMRATMSSGSETHSLVTPRTNSPGWMTNASPSSMGTCSVRLVGGSRRAIAAARWLWKTRNELPSRRSTLAGWASAGSHGSMRMRSSSTRRLMVPSDSTGVAMPGWDGPRGVAADHIGLYGPDTVTWRVNREAVLLAGGGRALLLQVAHPLVAAGVARHSTFETQPWTRLHRTLDLVTKITFGDRRTSELASARLRGVHARVQGTAADGTPYSARDPDLLLWVWATLVDS